MKMASVKNSQAKNTNFNLKYNEIRDKLDKLKYKYHLDISSIQLVELMIIDITKYLSEIQQLKNDNVNVIKENENLSLQSKAYKNENSRLIKENNDLHREIIEFKKNLNFSSNAKTMEVKRLSEEKNDFKFLYTETKNKLEKAHRENSDLKLKMSVLLNKIYDGNMNEKTLRKMFEKDENIKIFNQFDEKTSKMNSDIELGIFVKPRGLSMNMNLSITGENFNNIDGDNTDIKANLFREIVKKTFTNTEKLNLDNPNTQNHNPEMEVYSQIKSLTLTSQVDNPRGTFIKGPNSDSQNESYLKEKILLLEKEIKEKNLEISRLDYLCRNENTPNNNSELVINFLKQDNKNIIEKYEKRIDIIAIENKEYEKTIKSLTSKINSIKNYNPYTKEVEKRLKLVETKNEELTLLNISLKNEIVTLKQNSESLKLQLKNYKDNFISKDCVLNNEEKYKKLHNDFISNQQLVKQLDDKIKETVSNHNTTQAYLLNENNEMKLNTQKLQKESQELLKEVTGLREENQILVDNINLEKLSTLKKDNLILELKEKLDNLTEDIHLNEKGQTTLKEKVVELSDQILSSKKKIVLLENEIERINNKNKILEKQIEIMENNSS